MFTSQSYLSALVAFVGIIFFAGCEVPELDTGSEQASTSSSAEN